MFIIHTNIYIHERVCTMYIHIYEFIKVFVHATYIDVYLCTCIYIHINVHEFMNM
jgi:hypothetical protein